MTFENEMLIKSMLSHDDLQIHLIEFLTLQDIRSIRQSYKGTNVLFESNGVVKILRRQDLIRKYQKLVKMAGLTTNEMCDLLQQHNMYIAGSSALWVYSGLSLKYLCMNVTISLALNANCHYCAVNQIGITEKWMPNDIDCFKQVYLTEDQMNLTNLEKGKLEREYHEYLQQIGWKKVRNYPDPYHAAFALLTNLRRSTDVHMMRVETYKKTLVSEQYTEMKIQIITQFCKNETRTTIIHNPILDPNVVSFSLDNNEKTCIDRFDFNVCKCYIAFWHILSANSNSGPVFGCRNTSALIDRTINISSYINEFTPRLFRHAIIRILKYKTRGFTLSGILSDGMLQSSIRYYNTLPVRSSAIASSSDINNISSGNM